MIWLILQMIVIILVSGFIGLACGVWFYHIRFKSKQDDIRADLSASRRAFADSEERRLAGVTRIGPFLSQGGTADPSVETSAQESQIRNQLEETQHLLERTVAESAKLSAEKDELTKELQIQNENALALQDQISGLMSDSTHLEQELQSHRVQIGQLHEKLRFASAPIEVSGGVTDDEHENLVWKTRYLGSRVAYLEEKLGILPEDSAILSSFSLKNKISSSPHLSNANGNGHDMQSINDQIDEQNNFKNASQNGLIESEHIIHETDFFDKDSAATQPVNGAVYNGEDIRINAPSMPLKVIDEEGIGEITGEEEDTPNAYGFSEKKQKFDNLQKIKGIGPKLEKVLRNMGINNFDQISRWNEEDIRRIDDRLKFKGRILRENWVEQAEQYAKENQ